MLDSFQNTCGVSVVEGYYRWHKFNVMEIASKGSTSASDAASRIAHKIRDQEG